MNTNISLTLNEGTNSISSWMEQQYLCLLATAPHPGAALFVPLTQQHLVVVELA